MAPRPRPVPGDYLRSRTHPYFRSMPHNERVVCKGYTSPPSRPGRCIGTVSPGTYLGPVSDVEHTHHFVTVRINGWWINIWTSQGPGVDCYASLVPYPEVHLWERHGWEHRYQDGKDADGTLAIRVADDSVLIATTSAGHSSWPDEGGRLLGMTEVL